MKVEESKIIEDIASLTLLTQSVGWTFIGFAYMSELWILQVMAILTVVCKLLYIDILVPRKISENITYIPRESIPFIALTVLFLYLSGIGLIIVGSMYETWYIRYSYMIGGIYTLAVASRILVLFTQKPLEKPVTMWREEKKYWKIQDMYH